MCAEEMVVGFHHVGLSVADLDRACRFYSDGLGMTREFAFEVEPAGLRGALMATPGGARIELLEREGSARRATYADPPEAALEQAYGHWALEVSNLDAACARMVAAGADVVWDPRPAPEPGRRMAYLRDPDGNLVELIA